jgi:hypothetical protein
VEHSHPPFASLRGRKQHEWMVPDLTSFSNGVYGQWDLAIWLSTWVSSSKHTCRSHQIFSVWDILSSVFDISFHNLRHIWTRGGYFAWILEQDKEIEEDALLPKMTGR